MAQPVQPAQCAFCPTPSIAGRLLGQLGLYLPHCDREECSDSAQETVNEFNAWSSAHMWRGWDDASESRLRAVVFG